MISKEEAIEISKKMNLEDTEQLAVIRRYIFDKHGKDTGVINRPDNIMTIHLMTMSFEAAANYYLGGN